MIRAALLCIMLGVACLLLSGCASAPQVIEKPVDVKVPVPVECKAPDVAVPPWPLAAVPDSASDFYFYKAALAEIKLREGYETRLRAALAACQ
ncbi:hypothetical protein R16034_00794 [Ralstonia edaphis]|uniref:Lipoprotein n=1 Tax=Ralstonia edaphi TaxID=3058599 RepID=A0AB72WYN4_9RALS|nr:hypothetical protein [Ralstonia sp. LMG 6871]CAJ0737634.1 hypothetical protein R16034_00794 [Ralstonia sp. LMG 6871]